MTGRRRVFPPAGATGWPTVEVEQVGSPPGTPDATRYRVYADGAPVGFVASLPTRARTWWGHAVDVEHLTFTGGVSYASLTRAHAVAALLRITDWGKAPEA